MKQFVTRFVLLAVALCVYGQALAYDCVVGDVCYNLDKAANTAAVASYVESPSDGKGAIAIPEAISYEGANYTVTSIEKSAFRSCEWLTSVVIPATVTSIESSTFYGCANLVSVTLPESLTEIRSATFYNCINLASVTIPGSVRTIGVYAFRGCTAVREIISLATIPPTCDNRALYDVNKSICKLLVAKESIERYKAAYQWEDFVNIAEYDSVDDITVDADDADTLYEVYNLQGAKVGTGLRCVDMSNALPRGVYILVSPNGTRKVRI